MSEIIETEIVSEPTETETAPGTDAGKPTTEERTFTQADIDRIVKERLDRERSRSEAAAKKASEEAERKAAEEQGKFRELYEAEVKARQEALDRMKSLELQSLRSQVAAETGLPNGLASRLIGETKEEIEEDAKKLLASIPKQPTPSLDGGAGSRRQSSGADKPTPEQIREMAARYNVRPEYLAEQYGVPLAS